MFLSVVNNPKHRNQAALHPETAKAFAPLTQVRVVSQTILFELDESVPRNSIAIPPIIRKSITEGLRPGCEVCVTGVDPAKTPVALMVVAKISPARKLKTPLEFYPSELEVKILPEMLHGAVISRGRILEIEYMGRTLLLTIDQVTTINRATDGRVTRQTEFSCFAESASIHLREDPASKARSRVAGSYDVLVHMEECMNKLLPLQQKLDRVKRKLETKEPLAPNESINLCVRETEAMEFLAGNVKELMETLYHANGRQPVEASLALPDRGDGRAVQQSPGS